MAKEKSRLENQIAIAEKQRNFELRKAENEMAIKTAKAVEDAAQACFQIPFSDLLKLRPISSVYLKTGYSKLKQRKNGSMLQQRKCKRKSLKGKNRLNSRNKKI